MSYEISVPTPFTDISELAESFHSRVDEERLMLPNPAAVPEGEWVEFAVTLADGSAALAGQGRCTGSFDNGEDRAPEHRFDVVMDSLQLDDMAQIFFERILQVRAAHSGDEPATGEINVGEAYADAEEVLAVEPNDVDADEYVVPAYAEVPEEEMPVPVDEYAPPVEEYAPPVEEYAPPVEEYAPPAEEYVAQADAGDAVAFDEPGIEDLESIDAALDESDEASDDGEPPQVVRGMRPVAAALVAPTESRIYDLPAPSAPGALPSPHGGEAVLTRPFLQATWSPEPAPRFDPSPSSGSFQYAVGAGLPRPAEPPRPDLDPSLRVTPAPRPGDAHAVPGFVAAAPAGGAGYAARGTAPEADADEPDDATADAYADDEAAAGGAYATAEHAADEYAADEYAEADEVDFSDDATLDADAFGAVAGDDDETRQHDVSGLPDDEELGIETLQVEIPDDD